MSTVYITTQGATVYRRSGQLLVCKKSTILHNVPETHARQLILVGNVNLTTPVMTYCLENQIEVVFLSQGGQFRGRLNGRTSRSVEVRRKQYERARDAAFSLRQASAFIAGKISNQIALARRQDANRSNAREMSVLAAMLRRSETATSIESLLGIEGAASAAYFRMFRGWIPKPFSFSKRTANPPRDEVNALLSLSYTLLYNRITTHLNLIGLDPYLGFFHQARNGHAALASDLMEEFRPTIADSLVLKLVRRKQIKPSDFEKTGNGIHLTVDGKRIFFREFEAKLAAKRQVPLEGNASLSNAKIIERQAYRLARVIRGEEDRYRPDTLK